MHLYTEDQNVHSLTLERELTVNRFFTIFYLLAPRHSVSL